MVGQVEDEIRIDAEDALGAIDGLEVRRVFSGWCFYRYGLLFAAAWEGEFRFRSRQAGHWVYEVVNRELLDRPDELVAIARQVIAKLQAEPAARTGHGDPGQGSIGMTAEDTRIVLRVGNDRPIVDHPGQPADYVHTDGTVWTWHRGWHLIGGVREGGWIVGGIRLRAYDLVTPGGDET